LREVSDILVVLASMKLCPTEPVLRDRLAKLLKGSVLKDTYASNRGGKCGRFRGEPVPYIPRRGRDENESHIVWRKLSHSANVIAVPHAAYFEP
jgi:hypothetical protein